MQSIMLLSTTLFALATATPHLSSRAGGPAAVPIPAECTTINPLPHANCGTGNVNGYMPSATFTNASEVYSAYVSGISREQCFEQCNGLSTCVSALHAQQVPTPPGYYGTTGGALVDACLLYSAYLDPNSFVEAPAGQYANATAIDIYCPAS